MWRWQGGWGGDVAVLCRCCNAVGYVPEHLGSFLFVVGLTHSLPCAALASMDDKEDYYKMLGLQNLRFRATQADIKKAYRQCVLKYHPDKMAQNEKVRVTTGCHRRTC